MIWIPWDTANNLPATFEQTTGKLIKRRGIQILRVYPFGLFQLVKMVIFDQSSNLTQ